MTINRVVREGARKIRQHVIPDGNMPRAGKNFLLLGHSGYPRAVLLHTHGILKGRTRKCGNPEIVHPFDVAWGLLGSRARYFESANGNIIPRNYALGTDPIIAILNQRIEQLDYKLSTPQKRKVVLTRYLCAAFAHDTGEHKARNIQTYEQNLSGLERELRRRTPEIFKTKGKDKQTLRFDIRDDLISDVRTLTNDYGVVVKTLERAVYIERTYTEEPQDHITSIESALDKIFDGLDDGIKERYKPVFSQLKRCAEAVKKDISGMPKKQWKKYDLMAEMKFEAYRLYCGAIIDETLDKMRAGDAFFDVPLLVKISDMTDNLSSSSVLDKDRLRACLVKAEIFGEELGRYVNEVRRYLEGQDKEKNMYVNQDYLRNMEKVFREHQCSIVGTVEIALNALEMLVGRNPLRHQRVKGYLDCRVNGGFRGREGYKAEYRIDRPVQIVSCHFESYRPRLRINLLSNQ